MKVVRREGQGGGAVEHSRAGRGSTKNNTEKRTHSHGTTSVVAMTTATLYTCTQQCTIYVCMYIHTHVLYVSTFSVLSRFLFSYTFLLSIS